MFEQLYQFVLEQIGKNDLVAGGAVLGAIAFVLNYIKNVPFMLLKWSRLLFVTEINIPDKTDAFTWINDWLAEHPYTQRTKRITVEAQDQMEASVKPYGAWNEKIGTILKYSPAPGRHVMFWKGHLLILNRVRREGTGDNAHRMYRESWEIKLTGKRKCVDEFITECREVSERDRISKIRVMEGERGYWQQSQKRRKRPLNSVILPPGMAVKIMQDVREFITNEEWYHKMNIPWRRGYLFTGPPGNGKSSLITAIASEIDFEICIINLRTVDEETLISLMSDVKERSILLLEDIDCIFDQRKSEQGVRVSLSTVLNLLDGVNAGEGRIVIMTSNHPEKLDPALVRPGRVDVSLELPNATASQASAMYARFFPHCKNSKDFGIKVEKLNVSMAKLQGYLLRHRHSMHDARSNIKEMVNANV